jgi:hypothetical protein
MLGFNKKEDNMETSQNTEQQNIMPFYQAADELGKEMIDSSKTIEKIRMNLLGWVLIDGEFKKIGKKYMNEKGAAYIASLLDSHIGKEVFLTKITEEDKVRIIHDLWNTLIRLMVTNVSEWDLGKDIGNWKAIRAIVINQAYFALCRGVDGTEKVFFENTHQSKSVINQNTAQKQPSGGFFG